MTPLQATLLISRMARYNLRVIFAGKFIWFLLTAFGFFGFFLFQYAWERAETDEALIYALLLFPGMLLIFYPTVFGIQNDEDSRILEILFGIPDYRYKVWGVRLVMIYIATYIIIVLFALIAGILMYPVNPFGMAAQLMFPALFYGNLAFMFSTITRSGNGTAVIMIIFCILAVISSEFAERTAYDILLNPYVIPRNALPAIWENTVVKNRVILLVGSVVWLLIGLLNLQKREKFI